MGLDQFSASVVVGTTRLLNECQSEVSEASHKVNPDFILNVAHECHVTM